MPDYKIREVRSRKELMQFVRFPDELYKDCPQYVPALHSDQVKSLTRVAPLKYCTHKLWLALDGNKVVGRISGMINPRYNELYGKKRARFGWFDCIKDIDKDFAGNPRSLERPSVGPFENIKAGQNEFVIWRFK